ncbi:hypothetical protein IKF73_03195 [Candidatus Saccharibacteria bacterium]|nr:hypothetical protein [Candidatus Saccharibacteria bacterium]
MKWRFGPEWPGDGGQAVSISADQQPTQTEKIGEILRGIMEQTRPTFKDFEGYRAEAVLIQDEQAVKRRYSVAAEKEESAEGMEPAVAYLLPTLFPTRKETFAFLANEFDDKFNGTDVALCVRNSQNDEDMIFSVDVTTATNPEHIKKKFERSAKRDWASRIKYCLHDNKRWAEESAPHFVLGMSPASQDRLLNSFIIKDDVRLDSRKKDADSDFIILSEMREQVLMQLSFLRFVNKKGDRGEQIAKLENLLPAINSSLCHNLKVDTNLPEKKWIETFQKRYDDRTKELGYKDNVYKNIIKEARQMFLRSRGQIVVQAASA